jgi:hypothetical protein
MGPHGQRPAPRGASRPIAVQQADAQGLHAARAAVNGGAAAPPTMIRRAPPAIAAAINWPVPYVEARSGSRSSGRSSLSRRHGPSPPRPSRHRQHPPGGCNRRPSGSSTTTDGSSPPARPGLPSCRRRRRRQASARRCSLAGAATRARCTQRLRRGERTFERIGGDKKRISACHVPGLPGGAGAFQIGARSSRRSPEVVEIMAQDRRRRTSIRSAPGRDQRIPGQSSALCIV